MMQSVATRTDPRNRKSLARRKGALTVEFALTAPVVFTLFFGCVELSRMNMIRNTSNNAAFEAARTVIVPGAQSSQAVSAAQTLMQAIGVQNAAVDITPSAITSQTTSVTVSISTPLTSNLYVSPLFLKGKTINSTCTMALENLSGS